MRRNSFTFMLTLLALGLCVGLVLPVQAEITNELDSVDFSWNYEFNVLPSTQDLDGNSVNDFAFALSGPSSLLNDGDTYYWSVNTNYSQKAYFVSDTATGIWGNNLSWADGYTIEFSVRINSVVESAVAGGSVVTGVFSESGHASWLGLFDDEQTWGYGGDYTSSLGTNDNSDAFHVFRIAQEPGVTDGTTYTALYSVWRDGVLLSSSLTSGTDPSSSYNKYNQLRLGDIGSDTINGNVDYDYFRLTSGAYAPVTAEIPEPSTLGLILCGMVSLFFIRRQK